MLRADFGCDFRFTPRQRHYRHRDDPLDNPGDIIEIARPLRQFCQPLAVADGLVRHRQREVQAPIEFNLVASGQ